MKDPFVMEFLTLKDGYSESHLELEDALTRRLGIGSQWLRVNLLFFTVPSAAVPGIPQ